MYYVRIDFPSLKHRLNIFKKLQLFNKLQYKTDIFTINFIIYIL